MTLIYLHLVTVIAALALGTVQVIRPKGTVAHRWIGYLTVGLFVTTALLSVGIREVNDGQLSWLHLLSALVLVSMVQGVRHARRGNIGAHRAWMRGVMIGACIAGLFALAPGRFLAALLYQG